MGSPKKQRKKYKNPTKHWDATRIKEEIKLLEKFGLRDKKEIWKIQSKLREFRHQAKKLIGMKTEQAKKEEKQLRDRLFKLSLIDKDAKIDAVLDLDIIKLMERRLQSLVFKKGLALTAKQARQLILHGHIFIDGKKFNIPSYLVTREEEDKIISNQKLPIKADQEITKTNQATPEKNETVKQDETR